MTARRSGRKLAGMSLLDHIRRCNTFDPAGFRPFEIAGRQVGWVLPPFAARLSAFPDVFRVNDDRVAMEERFDNPPMRTHVMREVVRRLVAGGALPPPRGEDYAVVTRWGEEPLMLIDRGIVSAFGLHSYGVHLNGYVRDGDRVKLWIGRRAPDKAVEPDKLDNIVAGGQPAGLSLRENLIKEAAEEADLPRDLAERAIPVGAISYCMEADLGVKPDTMFVYDLELPADFVPRNTDGEISHFTLMDVTDVDRILRTSRDFKFNVPLVIIDFFIRHGILRPDDEPDYMDLVMGLRNLVW